MNEEYDPAVHHGILCRQALSPTSSRSRRVLPDASVFSEDPGRDADASAVSSPFGNRPRPDRDECFPLPSFLRRVLLRLTQPPVRAASPDPDRTFLENMIDEHSARDLAAFDRRWVSSGPVGLGSMGTVSVVRRREDGTPRRRRRRNGDADPSSASSTSGTASCASDATPERPEDGRAFALKTVRTERASPAFTKELRNEVEILRGLDHPNIVRPVEVFETGAAADRRLFLVMELCSGGDLHSRHPYTENQSALIIGKVLSALTYMHSRNIIHRDIKYENIMFEHNGPDAEVKLIDFGLSVRHSPGCPTVTGTIGTIYSMSPEILSGSCTPKTDLWSTGVVAFLLLSGRLPFRGSSRAKVVARIRRGRYRWTDPVSPAARDLVRALLQMDPDRRPPASEARGCPWLRRHAPPADPPSEDDEAERLSNAFRRYARAPALKRAALMLVARASAGKEVAGLRRTFDRFDRERAGDFGPDDLRRVLSPRVLSDRDLGDVFRALDFNGTGRVRYTEFLAATLEMRGCVDEDRLAEAFDRLDCDGSGRVSRANLLRILGTDRDADWGVEEPSEERSRWGRREGVSYAKFLRMFRTEGGAGSERRTRSADDPRPNEDEWKAASSLRSTSMTDSESTASSMSSANNIHAVHNS